jgi:hypothetical protein
MTNVTLTPAAYPLRQYELDLVRWQLEQLQYDSLDLTGDRWLASASETLLHHSPSDLVSLAFVDSFEADGIRHATQSRLLEGGDLLGQRSRSQAHRYLVHGFHQYRGKFYPQIARALIVGARLSPGEVVFDPFVGSGTTLVEASLLKQPSVGMDLSPMATFLAAAKLVLLRSNPDRYLDEVAAASRALKDHEKEQHRTHDHLRPGSYLFRWLDPGAQRVLDCALEVIGRSQSEECQLILRLCLSRRVREWSMQNPEDLRVRRRSSPPDTSAALSRLAEGAWAMASNTAHAWDKLESHELGSAKVTLGDARENLSHQLLGLSTGSVGAIITSPPYASALPYIDTDRLSLLALGLVPDGKWRAIEASLIGGREIKTSDRKTIEQRLSSGELGLPDDCLDFLQALMHQLELAGSTVGFRRRNMPALLTRYFVDFDACARNWSAVCRPGALVAVVVGDSRIRISGEWIVIPTRRLIGSILERRGFSPKPPIELTNQPAYSVHQENVIRSESILIHVYSP